MQYDKSFKEEALKLSDEIGVKAAAAQLGIPYYTLSGWRNNRKKYGADLYCGSGHKRMSADPAEQRIRELERKMQNLNMPMRFFRKHLVFSHNAERSKSSSALSVHP